MYDSHFDGHTWHSSSSFGPGLSVAIPPNDPSIVPFTPFATELLETYATEAEAKYAMESKYGFSMKLNGTKPNRQAGKVSNYNCSVSGCGLHVRLTCDNKTSLWTVDVSKKLTSNKTRKDVHTHPEENDSEEAWINDTLTIKERGLPQPFKVIIDRMSGSSSAITAVDCYRFLQKEYHDSDIERLRLKVTEGEAFRFLKNQIRSYITRKHFKRHGRSLMSTMSYYQQLASSENSLPDEYEATDQYTSPESIREALNLPAIYSQISFDMSSNRWKTMVQTFVKDKPTVDKWKNDLELSFLIVTPASLYTLLQLVKRRPGSRAICCDGTHGLVSTGHKLIVIGPLDVRYRSDSKNVTSSLKPCCYLVAREESKAPFTIALQILNFVARTYFGRRLEIDFGEADKTDAFLRPYVEYNPDIDPSTRRSNTDVHLTTRGTDDPEFSPNAPSLNPLRRDLDSASHVFESGTTACTNQIANNSFPTITPKCTPLNCLWHVLHQFTAGKPLYNKFVLTKNGKKAHFAKIGMRNFMNTAKCKSSLQFNTVLKLYLQQWILDGQEKAAEHGWKEYGVSPYNCWWYAVSGYPGVYPQGCSNESYNVNSLKGSKMVTGIVQLKVSMQRFLGCSIPEILSNDALNNMGECEIVVPVDIFETTSADVAILMTLLDVHVMTVDEKCENCIENENDHQLVNTSDYVGREIKSSDIQNYFSSLQGTTSLFEEEQNGLSMKVSNPARVAKRMVNATRRFCMITRRNGILLGDCELCMKRLGYGCNGLVYLRNKEDTYSRSLSELTGTVEHRISSDPYKGPSATGLGGPSKKRKTGITVNKTCGLKPYFESKNHVEIRNLCVRLNLITYDTEKEFAAKDSAKQKSANLKLLLGFIDDPKQCRIEQLKQWKTIIADKAACLDTT
jgi:hypothetical protein